MGNGTDLSEKNTFETHMTRRVGENLALAQLALNILSLFPLSSFIFMEVQHVSGVRSLPVRGREKGLSELLTTALLSAREPGRWRDREAGSEVCTSGELLSLKSYGSTLDPHPSPSPG